jgi:DNA-binding transcriptional LysR family regulator
MDLRLLRKFDMNSLVVLKVLLDECHVTRAAQQLNLTQSAVSRSLARLRQAFDDPLLVSVGKQLTLTPAAIELVEPLNALLSQAEALLQPQTFDPQRFLGSVRLATSDYGTHSILPRLIPMVTSAAPGVKLTALEWPKDTLSDLEQNKVDLIIGGGHISGGEIYQRVMAREPMYALVRRGHPFAAGINLKQYLSLKHIIISSTGHGLTEVDRLLKTQGLQRDIAVRVSHFFAALGIIANTDHIILVPQHFIKRYVNQDDFVVLPPPFEVPDMEVIMFWHARLHKDPFHQWFRQFIVDELYAKRSRNNQTPLTT